MVEKCKKRLFFDVFVMKTPRGAKNPKMGAKMEPDGIIGPRITASAPVGRGYNPFCCRPRAPTRRNPARWGHRAYKQNLRAQRAQLQPMQAG